MSLVFIHQTSKNREPFGITSEITGDYLILMEELPDRLKSFFNRLEEVTLEVYLDETEYTVVRTWEIIVINQKK